MSQSLPPETPETPENPDPSEATPSSPEAESGVAVAEAPAEPGVPTPATDERLLRRALEGLLFITDRPLSAGELGRLVGVRDQERIAEAVEGLRRELEERDGGYRLMAVAEGWQMATRPELAPFVRKLFADRATMRLSTAAQETLSIVAYRQPLTRAEIESIRGVEVIAALETLLEKRLLKVVGRKETVGRPLLYGTTPEFLRHYGLRSLEDMPPIDSFSPADAAAPTTAPSDGPFAPVDSQAVPQDESYARAQSEPEPLPEREPETLPEPQTPETPSEEDGGGAEKKNVWPD
ncbi:MAG: SMC-Scp complex subunit ScpB [Elusimicrobiota bacterium]|nr:SMC-Scp complex subunit ScpB [Elusimicrobiota bacterium]